MRYKHFFCLGILCLQTVWLQAQPKKKTSQKPNIILVLVDDMGYADLGCYGSSIPTPNLDKLASKGIRFTQFYNNARCCPTRASLLTGVYAHQAGIGHMTGIRPKSTPSYQGYLNQSTVTLAEALKGAGYFTSAVGKWHVGNVKSGQMAANRGFDRSLIAEAGGFYFPESEKATLFLNGQKVDKTSNKLPKNWYSSDLFADFGIRFIDEAQQQKKPFFLYLAYNAPHFPLQAPQKDIDRFKGKFSQGWSVLRQEIFERQQSMGLIDKQWVLSPKVAEVPEWASLDTQNKATLEQIQEIYAAVVSRMDKAMGSLVSELEKRKLMENTLIVFLSDNGANAESGIMGRLKGDQPGSVQSTVFQGQTWATSSNTPFLRYKHYTNEGGIATPCIVHWPAGIDSRRNGTFERYPSHIIDIMPTFLEVAKGTYPKTYNKQAITPMEGISLTPLFQSKPVTRSQPLFWEHEGNRAVRDGKWKLVARFNQEWQLFDMEADRTENHDLAATYPDRVKQMTAQYNAWAARCQVLPWSE